jgi:hypothetical protein
MELKRCKRISLSHIIIFFLLSVYSCSSNKEVKGDNKSNIIVEKDSGQTNSVVQLLSDIDTIFYFNDTSMMHLRIYGESIPEVTYNGVLDNKAYVILSMNDKEIYKQMFNKNAFDIRDQDFLKQSILSYCSLEKIDFERKKIVFAVSITKPETDWVYLYEIEIDIQGKKQMFFIEEDGTRELLK